MPIFHVKTSPVADGTNTNLVLPSDWNASHVYTMQEAVSVGGNYVGVVGNISSGTLVLAGGNNITLSQNANTITISGEAYTISEYDPFGFSPVTFASNSTIGLNTLYFQPFDLGVALNASRLNLFVSVATTLTTTINSTGSAFWRISACLYTRGTGASSDRIMSFWSEDAGFTVTMSSHTQQVITNLAGIANSTAVSTVVTSLSTSNASTYMATSMGGFRVIPLPIATTLLPGRYWLAIANSFASANTGLNVNCSVLQNAGQSNFVAYRPFGVASAASNASLYGVQPGLGSYSATSGVFPDSVALTTNAIRMPVQNAIKPYFNISGYGTNTNLI